MGKKDIEEFVFADIIGESKEIKETIEIARKVALTDIPVLLLGETGVGKEIFAKAIHYESSRRESPFIQIKCSAHRSDLLETEMFGNKMNPLIVSGKKGMFDEACSGTIFLDDILELDPFLQAKLLEILEMKSDFKTRNIILPESDVRIISATNRNPEHETEINKFRKDLYYRIGVVKIEIPPLRKRKEDIEPLARYFIKEFSDRMKRSIKGIDKDFIDRLISYSYPGNIRELRNVIERTVILTDGEILKAPSLPKEFFEEKSSVPNVHSSSTLDEIEKHHILKILRQTKGNKTKTAEILGIGLTTLYRKLQEYRIE